MRAKTIAGLLGLCMSSLLALPAAADEEPDGTVAADCSPSGDRKNQGGYFFDSTDIPQLNKDRGEPVLYIGNPTANEQSRRDFEEAIRQTNGRRIPLAFLWHQPRPKDLPLFGALRAAHEKGDEADQRLIATLLRALASSDGTLRGVLESKEPPLKVPSDKERIVRALKQLSLDLSIPPEGLVIYHGWVKPADELLGPWLTKIKEKTEGPITDLWGGGVSQAKPLPLTHERTLSRKGGLPQLELWGSVSEGSSLLPAMRLAVADPRFQLTWRFRPHGETIPLADLAALELAHKVGAHALFRFIEQAARIDTPDREKAVLALARDYGVDVRVLAPKRIEWLEEQIRADHKRYSKKFTCPGTRFVVALYALEGAPTAKEYGRVADYVSANAHDFAAEIPQKRERWREPHSKIKNSLQFGSFRGAWITTLDEINGDNGNTNSGRLIAQMEFFGLRDPDRGGAGWSVGGGNGLDLSAHVHYAYGFALPKGGPWQFFGRVGGWAMAETEGAIGKGTKFGSAWVSAPQASTGVRAFGTDWAFELEPTFAGYAGHLAFDGVQDESWGYTYGANASLALKDFQFFARGIEMPQLRQAFGQLCWRPFSGKKFGVCANGRYREGKEDFDGMRRISFGASAGLIDID